MNGDNLIGHGIIDYLVVFILMIYAYWAGQTKPHRILYILPACLSFFFFIEIGPRLTPEKLVPTIFIASVVLSKGSNYFSIQNSNNSWAGKMWLLIVLSIIVGIFFTNYYSNYIKSPLINNRLIIQITSYINFILIFIITRKECSKPSGKAILLKSFLVTTIILCIYGIYQYFAHELGLPYRGIVYSEDSTGIGLFSDAENAVFRINSFANEPKRLTYFLVIGLIILFKYKDQIIKKTKSIPYYLLVVVHATILWLTYSTSIYFSIIVFILLLILYLVFIKYNKTLFRQLVVLIFLSIGAYFYQEEYFINLYEVRVEQQLDTEDKRAEVKGQEFLIANPELFIVGLGPGLYNFALAKEYPKKAGLSENGKFLVPFNSGLLTYLYDFGILGFYLLSIPLLKIVFNKKATNNDFSIFVTFIYCTAITLNPTATYFFFIGAFDGIRNLEQ